MAGKRGQRSELPTDVDPRYTDDFLEAMDGRARVARTLRDRMRALLADLGGPDQLSYMERSLVKRAIHVERLIEKRELTLAHGGTVDDQAYFSGITALSSLFSKLGLKRRAKQLPSLHEYAAQSKAESESM